ncbi:MAG TPA: transketolase C-terminal domain-containing protein, partial [Polyangiaceae bacterium]|nr:transketolase C-terminal domain-containing protein [Polyangiaceae bacterium]
ALQAALGDLRRIVTVEDHNVIGGLGSAVAELLAESGKSHLLRRLGHQDCWLGMGVPEDLMHSGGFDEDAIVAAVEALLQIRVERDQDWDRA